MHKVRAQPLQRFHGLRLCSDCMRVPYDLPGEQMNVSAYPAGAIRQMRPRNESLT